MSPYEWLARLPWSIVLLALALMLLGLTAIGRVEVLTDGSGRFLRAQALWCGLSLLAMFSLASLHHQRVCRWAYPALIATLLLLSAVYAFPAINGAHRWIRIAGLSLQPSELAKVALVLALARWLMDRDNGRGWHDLIAPLAMTLLPVGLILREPDLGTAMVFVPVLVIMLWTAGTRSGDLAKLAIVALALLPLVWTGMSREQRSRVTALLDQPPPGATPSDDAYHLHQAKQMLALGGVWGSLLAGDAVDDYGAYRLPEAHSDFIFCVLGERLGWLGTGGALLLWVLLVGKCLQVALATRDRFGRLVAAGIAALLAVESLINTTMTVGLAPITGLSLPLVSYGGSGLLAHGIALGLVLGIGARAGDDLADQPFQQGMRLVPA